MHVPVIAEGDPAPPELLDVIQCRAISVLGRYVDATSSTPFCNCHGRQDCLHPCTATSEISKPSEELGHCETDYIDSNLPYDSDDGLE